MKYDFSDHEGPTLAKKPMYNTFEIAGITPDTEGSALIISGFLITAGRNVTMSHEDRSVDIIVGEMNRRTELIVSEDLSKTAPTELQVGKRIRIMLLDRKVTRIF